MSIEVLNESSYDVDEKALVMVARHVLQAMGVSPLAELSLMLVDIAHMSELHEKWMDEPGPTDVMAFRMDGLDLRGSRGARHTHEDKPSDAGPAMLGDVVLCPAVAAEQAREAGHGLTDELELLTTHGILHLLGFDHEDPQEHTEMFGLQGELLLAWKAARQQ